MTDWLASPSTDSGAEESALRDLRQRLQDSQKQERLARTQIRRLARELALARRLMAFSIKLEPAVRPETRPRPAARPSGNVRAVPLTPRVHFQLDSLQTAGAVTSLVGWAFQPVSTWDAQAASVAIVLRHGGNAYVADAAKMFRPDVAAHFAAEIGGGATRIGGAGFVCEIESDSLPKGVDLEVVLRLECGGAACECPTGKSFRL